jgi:Fe-S cluster assembly ATP-binding protein
VLAVTHYPRLLEYLKPDKVHVLVGGRIVRTGDQELAHELEERGYGWLQVEQAAKAETAR